MLQGNSALVVIAPASIAFFFCFFDYFTSFCRRVTGSHIIQGSSFDIILATSVSCFIGCVDTISTIS